MRCHIKSEGSGTAIEYAEAIANAASLLVLAVLKALFALLFSLASVLLDLLWRRILDELAVLVQAGPLGKTIRDVDAALTIEHVKSAKIRSA